VEQVENRVSGTEDKVEELDQTIKDHEKMLRKYEWNMQHLGHHEKTKPMNHEYRRRRRDTN
jgi:DNA-binding protein H-NS